MIERIPTRSLRTFKASLAALGIIAALAGCSSGKWGFPYKVDVQQGNWITQEQIALLQPGMSREQVRFALGSPMLTSVLHADRWDYPYFYKPGYGKPRERKFTVWFENDRLARWQGDEQPTLQPYQLDEEGNPIEIAPAPQAAPAAPADEPQAAPAETPEAQPIAPQAEPAGSTTEPAASPTSPIEPQGQPAAPEASPTEPQAQPAAPQASPTEPETQPTTPQVELITPIGPPASPDDNADQTPPARPSNLVIQPQSNPAPYSPGLPGSDAEPLR